MNCFSHPAADLCDHSVWTLDTDIQTVFLETATMLVAEMTSLAFLTLRPNSL